MPKLMFWPNHARSIKVKGEMAHYMGGACKGVYAAVGAREENGGISIEASIRDIDDSSISCYGRMEPATKHTEKSPDFRGEFEVPKQGKFKIVAWRRLNADEETFLSCIVEALALNDSPPSGVPA